MIPKALTASLTAICGPDGVIVDPDRLLVYESDALTAYRHRPGAVVLPRTTDELRRTVGLVSRAGLPIVPRGAGTGLSGGAVALGGGVVVGTARMNRILEIDAPNRRAVLQPGVINAELSVAAAVHGLYYAPDPSSQTACTIGGNVAENSGGPHCLKYGVTSRYVTGLTIVQADGSVAELGGLGREAPGYDLVGLFVGSEGCFGIAAEIEVVLLPVPEGVRTLLGIFDRIEDAGAAVSDIVGAGLLPAAMEIIDGPTIRAVEDSVFAAGYPTDAEAALVIEFDGLEAGLDPEAGRAAELCRRAGAREVRSARDEAERMALWKGRKKAFGAMGRIAPDLLVQDATVPRTTLPAILKGISEIASRYDLVVANVFHAGDGNLHPNILFDRRNRAELERVERASKEIMQICVNAGGTITGEHGVGLDKKHHMQLIYGPAELDAMWGLRRVFDPAGVMNPGKVLPDGTEPVGKASEAGEVRVEAVGAAPEAVVFPESAEEVRAVVRAAIATGVRLLPAGNGRWPCAGGWGREAQAIVSTARMDGVVHYEPADLTLTAGAGLGMRALGGLADRHGQWLPMDAPGCGDGTLGSAVASGVSGPLQGRYGGVRDNVLGLEVVTGDARILQIGGRVVKNVAGYDMVRLFTGSRGSLGVITRVSVRLFPRPGADVTLCFQGGAAEVVEMAREVCTASFPVAAAEIVGACAGQRTRGAREEDGGGLVLAVRLLGGTEEVEEARARAMAGLGRGPDEVFAGGDSAAFHEERTRWEDGSPVVARLTALPDRMGDVMACAGRVAGVVGGEVAADALRGLVRVKGSCAPGRVEAVAECMVRARAEMADWGGSLALSSAPHEVVEVVGWVGAGGGAGGLTGRVKALFDPHYVFASECP